MKEGNPVSAERFSRTRTEAPSAVEGIASGAIGVVSEVVKEAAVTIGREMASPQDAQAILGPRDTRGESEEGGSIAEELAEIRNELAALRGEKDSSNPLEQSQPQPGRGKPHDSFRTAA